MIPADCMRGRKVALFGLGGSGLATAAALVAGGAEIIVWDDNAAAVDRARGQGLATQDLRLADWADMAALVLSPGVPLTHPQPHWSVKLARARGVEVIGDIEIFARVRDDFLKRRGLAAQDCPLVAITGTNGKSTTTALVAHLLKTAGCDVQTGGNIGTAVLSLAPPAAGRVYVIECSSYQIDLAPSLHPTVGILLNLTPDHIDRHGSFAGYAAVKERLVAASDTAVIALDDAPCRRIFERLGKAGKIAGATGRTIVPVAAGKALRNGCFADGRTLVHACSGRREVLASLEGDASLRGRHNAQNALAALACCIALGIPAAAVREAFASFKGLPHRMEEVRRKGHVLFVNDSKATNAQAAAPALAAFDHIYWIAGGVPKQGGIDALREFFLKIRKAYLIGDAAPGFAAAIGDAAPAVLSVTLADAVRQAARDAAADRTGEAVVLLSPACASFDQFTSYTARGDAFRRLVEAL